MFLKKIRLCNFRGFYGTHTIEFADQLDQCVTIIHGENGAGKTNLLNAIYWCLTASFTPRLSEPELLVNKSARDDRPDADCFVEVFFSHDGRTYQAVRTVINRRETRFNLYHLENDAPIPVQKPEQFIEKIIPKGLSRWFFFDAEAIGELELSGSDEFRNSLRRILGFGLVDTLIEDLKSCLSKKRRSLTNAVGSKELNELQQAIDNIEHVLPGQRIRAKELESELKQLDSEAQTCEMQLSNLPKSKPLQDQRSRLETQRQSRVALKKELKDQFARFLGESAQAVHCYLPALSFENQLHIKENTGRLPAPYSDQLVEDILRENMCLCGRSVLPNSLEAQKIRALLKSAATGEFNARVRSVQYLIKDIKGVQELYSKSSAKYLSQIQSTDTEIAGIDEDLREIRQKFQQIDEAAISSLEERRNSARTNARNVSGNLAIVKNHIAENENRISQLRQKFETKSRGLHQGEAIQKEIDKIKRLSDYVTSTLDSQERRSLNVMLIELNNILQTYLTKDYRASINRKSYSVDLLDEKGRPVGASTGEGQVLKFAFISTVVALAGRKTQEKINFLAEPTIAPLVLDAPFSALDPVYQSAVATNLARQSAQLVLLISSAAWSDSVARALNGLVGKRYILISCQRGPQGNRPIKTMKINGETFILNKYDCDIDESSIEEVKP